MHMLVVEEVLRNRKDAPAEEKLEVAVSGEELN